jgi:hypothetical protein
VDIDVVGMVQAASQRCHSDVRCDCHEAHQCHLVDREYGSYGKVQYEGGLLVQPQTASDTQTQTHHLGHKTSFLRVENMWIFGTKKWTDCLQHGQLGLSLVFLPFDEWG